MEGRRDSTSNKLPSSPLFSHPPSPDPYMEELLQGLVNQSRQAAAGDGQTGFQPWSGYGDEGTYQQSNFMDWHAFRPTLDLSTAARSDSRNSNNSSLAGGPFTGYEDYLSVLRSEQTKSQLETPETGVCGSAGGFLYPNAHDDLLSGSQNLGATADSGRQLYAEALNHWVNFTGKTYEPFGKTEVFPAATDREETSSPTTLSESTCGSDSGSAVNPALNSKPTYSDVARNQPAQSSFYYQPNAGKPKSGPNTPPCDEFKLPEFPSAAPHPRLHSHRHNTVRPHNMKPRSPTLSGSEKPAASGRAGGSSRMGLDHFEDVALARERYKQQVNCSDGSNPQSRKGSGSSVGSGSSGMDDLTFLLRPHLSASGGASPNLSTEDLEAGGSGCEMPMCDGLGSELTHESSSSPLGSTAKSKSRVMHKGTARPRAASSPLPCPEGYHINDQTATPRTGPLHKHAAAAGEGSSTSRKKTFFDPKRIFDQKSATASTPKMPNTNVGSSHSKPAGQGNSNSGGCSGNTSNAADGNHIPQNNQNHHNKGTSKEKSAGGGNLLNNGKHKSNLYTSNNVHTKPTSTHYINNDLRQPPKKQTNTEGRNSPNRSAPKSTNTHPTGEPAPQDHHNTADPTPSSPSNHPEPRPAGPPPGPRRKQDHSGKRFSDPRPHPKRSRRHRDTSVSHRGELLVQSWEWCKWMCKQLMQHATSIFLLVLKVTLALLAVGLSGVISALNQLWQWVRMKVPYLRRKSNPEENESFDWSNPSSQSRFKTVGLEKNITLPTTGEEAMKRLLACKGKDPYSILGVRVDSPDEEIKRYYRKQAVLVHPDKNKIPGAEEAFKILGHSFDIIGEPEKRSKYDAQRLETQETETAMHEFADLLTKLRSKMQEAVNLMRCEKCGGRHRRVPTERPWYNARFCDRCNVRHSAKEGDVWAESRVMGFLWHYYACMEGKIYDITEWASCQSGNFKHIQANAHHVIYRIATQAGARQRTQNNSGRGGSEPDLEEFINHLFHRSARTDGGSPESPQQPSNPSAASAASAAANASAKKRRGKKKKH